MKAEWFFPTFPTSLIARAYCQTTVSVSTLLSLHIVFVPLFKSKSSLQLTSKTCKSSTAKTQKLCQICFKEVGFLRNIMHKKTTLSIIKRIILTDIALNNDIFKYWRVGLRWDVFPKKLWKNRTIPYIISPLYEPEDMITILTAIRTITRMTCLKFPKWDGKKKDFLLIWPIKYPKVWLMTIIFETQNIFRRCGFISLEQWGSNYVPRHTRVPWESLKCAAKKFRIQKRVKILEISIVFKSLNVKCAAKETFVNKVCRKFFLAL